MFATVSNSIIFWNTNQTCSVNLGIRKNGTKPANTVFSNSGTTGGKHVRKSIFPKGRAMIAGHINM
jgi:hypothetical protein